MEISVDVYTASLDEGIHVFRQATDSNVRNLRLSAESHHVTKKVKYYNLSFDIDHHSTILDHLDNGNFTTEPGKLKL